MPELSLVAWGLLAIGAVIIGVSKTALPGASILSIALLATVLPARTSTAAMLLLLIVGDVFALIAYRRHAHWPTLVRLAPAVVAGLLAGFAFLALGNDTVVRRGIAVILLAMIALTLWRRRHPVSENTVRTGWLTAAGYGSLGGFTTMVANAGGPVMSMYFLATRAPIKVFLGTAAWFFAIVNLMKVPFLAGIGLFTPSVLIMDAVLAPGVVIGALIGLAVASRINQQLFDRIVIVLTVVGSLYLLI
ncbi:sulfite exporter TauE/SafE family protein [Microbacterium sp. YY-01]|uniref:sulfite exporter TauE/SafE family protein n=1 Tax=Microbacterium sp. YY-01 TaxID=3421634 RepID=UPI003D163DF5